MFNSMKASVYPQKYIILRLPIMCSDKHPFLDFQPSLTLGEQLKILIAPCRHRHIALISQWRPLLHQI